MTISSPARGVNASRSRDHNRQLVLGHLQAGGALGRAELARRSGLSTQAVSNIIAGLETEGLLRPEGMLAGRRGLPTVQYAVNACGAYALGIEVRPAVLLAALLDLAGDLVWHHRMPLADATPAGVAAALPALLIGAHAAVPFSRGRLLGAGVALPGPFGRTGVTNAGSELPGWDAIDPAALLQEALDLPVTVANDANAAAMAERVAAAPEGLTHLACLYFGTGLGLGIVQDGRLMTGAFGNAGEIGHIRVATPVGAVRLEDCLSRLSVETHLADAGLFAAEMEMLERLHETGDPHLMEWLDAALDPLSQAIALIENMLDPQSIVLCGAMPERIVRDLVARVRLPAASVSRRADAAYAPLRVGRCSRLAATRGAAALVLNTTFTPALAS